MGFLNTKEKKGVGRQVGSDLAAVSQQTSFGGQKPMSPCFTEEKAYHRGRSISPTIIALGIAYLTF